MKNAINIVLKWLKKFWDFNLGIIIFIIYILVFSIYKFFNLFSKEKNIWSWEKNDAFCFKNKNLPF